MKINLNMNLVLKCLASAFTIVMFNACSKEKNRELAPTALYQESGMHPVSSSFNQKKQVISILYANAVVRNVGNLKNITSTVDQKYTLVTWKQKPHPLWFGGNTNAEILFVEKINLSKTEKGISNIHYQKQLARNGGKAENNMDVRERIRYILEQKFSKFPG